MSKTKSFADYLKKRLDKKEITEIEKQASLECKALAELQHDVSTMLIKYMADEDIGFNEVVRRLHVSPTQANKIIKGEANLTLISIAHIAALLQKKPKLVFV